MPVHDWSLLNEDDYRSFRHGWIVAIRTALTRSILPPSFYATVERRTLQLRPFSLRVSDREESRSIEVIGEPAVSYVRGRPQTQYRDEVSYSWRSLWNDRIGVYRIADESLVAYVEILSHDHKSRPQTLEKLHDRFEEVLHCGCNLLVIDLIPPSSTAPYGTHAAFWSRFTDTPHTVTDSQPFGIAAYQAGLIEGEVIPTAYFETVSVGQNLPVMPLFLSPDEYVNLPLQETYDEAWVGTPRHWKTILEAPNTP